MHKYEGLKDLVKEEHFKMEGLHLPPDLLKPGDLIVKVNLKDAYLQVPIYPESQTIIYFSLFTGNRNFTESPTYHLACYLPMVKGIHKVKYRFYKASWLSLYTASDNFKNIQTFECLRLMQNEAGIFMFQNTHPKRKCMFVGCWP